MPTRQCLEGLLAAVAPATHKVGGQGSLLLPRDVGQELPSVFGIVGACGRGTECASAAAARGLARELSWERQRAVLLVTVKRILFAL